MPGSLTNVNLSFYCRNVSVITVICLQLFHLVPRSHQISKPQGGGAGREQEALRNTSCCQHPPPASALTLRPKTELDVWRVHPVPCSPSALRRRGRCSCQPGSGRESKLSSANTAEITGFISGHMVVSSGREEAAAASLPNS